MREKAREFPDPGVVARIQSPAVALRRSVATKTP
jgi:hypothetical protein